MMRYLTRIICFACICFLNGEEFVARKSNLRIVGIDKLVDITNTSKDATNDIGSDYPYLVDSVTWGITRAIEECKHQFRWDKWNCPVTKDHFLTTEPNTDDEINVPTTREDSYLQAISSAGVMYYLAKTCNHPSYNVCGCDPNTSKYEDLQQNSTTYTKYHWGGCGHNTAFGEKVAKLALGTDKNGAKAVIKRHNEQAGRKAVLKFFKRKCKCYGGTATCPMVMCWKELGDFRAIAAILKEKYKKAKQVRIEQDSTGKQSQRITEVSKVTEDDLVYIGNYPSYCYPDTSTGFSGTVGRECLYTNNKKGRKSMSKYEMSSCRRLCTRCGYRVEPRVIVEMEPCQCEFKWCCKVSCQQCERNTTKYFCQ